MTVESKLEEAFIAYLNLAKAKLHPGQADPSKVVPFELLRNRSIELRHLVDEIEMRPEFSELVKETLVVSPRVHSAHEDSEDVYFAVQWFTGVILPDSAREDLEDPAAASRYVEIQNFFRRSRCYTSIYGGEPINPGTTLRDLITQFRKEQIQTRYLVPLKNVGFSDANIEFQGFQIRRFSAEELDEILQTDVNEVFYESSTVDASKVEGYWLIDLIPLPESPSQVQANVDDGGRLLLQGHLWLTTRVFQSRTNSTAFQTPIPRTKRCSHACLCHWFSMIGIHLNKTPPFEGCS